MIALFFTSLVNVFMRSVQQLNVQHDRKWWVPPVSLGMAICEVSLVVKYSYAGFQWHVVFVTAAGAASGCLAGMHLHKQLRKK